MSNMQNPPPEGDQENNIFIYSVYAEFEEDVLAQVRQETYGEDIGQFSWITADEIRGFFHQLDLKAGSNVLDVACGSGGPALFMAHSTGAQVTGIDINEGGINTANGAARTRGLHNQARFQQIDAGEPLPFSDASFDAIICIDAINHLYNREEVFSEWFRVLRPGGSFLFTDAVIVTGMLLRDEILARSSGMSLFIFTPPGVHDSFIKGAGFIDIKVEDVTETIASVSKKWHDARAAHADALLKIEGEAHFIDLQSMLSAAHTLSSEKRLSRFAYQARKP